MTAEHGLGLVVYESEGSEFRVSGFGVYGAMGVCRDPKLRMAFCQSPRTRLL